MITVSLLEPEVTTAVEAPSSFEIHSKKYGTKTVLVDPEDYEAVINAGPWHVYKAYKSDFLFYAQCHARELNGKKRTQLLHRFILELHGLLDPNKGTDHIDGNGLNNQKSNLRIATHAENSQNRKLRKDSTSGCKGVSWNKNIKKWHAQIKINYKEKHLGYFDDKFQACAVAYIERFLEYDFYNDQRDVCEHRETV